MKILINGNEQELGEAVSIAQLLSEKQIGKDGIAVALNQNVIPRDQWEKTTLKENDNVLIIKATKGG